MFTYTYKFLFTLIYLIYPYLPYLPLFTLIYPYGYIFSHCPQLLHFFHCENEPLIIDHYRSFNCHIGVKDFVAFFHRLKWDSFIYSHVFFSLCIHVSDLLSLICKLKVFRLLLLCKILVSITFWRLCGDWGEE